MGLERLLEETAEAYYWAGFLLADGCISKRRDSSHDLILVLSVKDIEHMKKFKKYIGHENTIGVTKETIGSKGQKCQTCRIVSCNSPYITQIMEKFDFKPRKTWNPPSLEILRKIENYHNICLFIGIIDGNGCIYNPTHKKESMVLGQHKSWMGVIQFYYNLIVRYFDSDSKAKCRNRKE